MVPRRRLLRLLTCILTPAAAAATTVIALAAPSGWLAVDGSIDFSGGGATYGWANSGSGPTPSCPAGAVNLAGTGGIFNCGRAGVGSNPPVAPSLTSAAAADPSIISAVFMSDPISSDTTSCGGGDPTVISGGAKNGDALTSIGTGSGSVPDKDDLGNVYAVSHTRADTGRPEMFFGAERLVNNGDSHIDFEFLQTNAGVTAPCSGSFTGNRTEGDLLVAIDFTGGGASASAGVFEWHCNAEPGPQPADGTVCNPTGIPHYQKIVTPSFLTFTVNASQVACGGWVCRDKISGTSTTVAARDFLEGGIDLAGIPFTGCFNTFLPHTRTAQSFTSGLKDFAGPVGLHSCRTPRSTSNSSPRTSGVAPGSTVRDTVTLTNGGAGPQPTGTVTFFLCGPAQVSGSGCSSGGVQVGSPKPLAAGSATSDPTSATATAGRYCWRTEFTPDAASSGVFTSAVHTNTTTECFSILAPTSLPNTGAPPGNSSAVPHDGQNALWQVVVLAGLLAGVSVRGARGLALILCGGVLAIAAPDIPQPVPASSAASASVHAAMRGMVAHPTAARPTIPEPARREWRLVIPAIGVDAVIGSVGVEKNGAMAAPATLDGVGWFNRGPVPGQRGDAVIAGHYGLPQDPAVFRTLALLRPGAVFEIVWPDGHRVRFRVTLTRVVDADGPAPPDVFSRTGPARLSLITCAGVWEQARATYSQRLIVTAELWR